MSATAGPTERPGVDAQRLHVDARGERVVARGQALAGALAVGAGAWLLALPHPVAWPFALAGIVFGTLWMRRALIQPRGERDYLELGHDALEHHEAGRTQRVLWRDVTAIDVDEDRLVVRIEHIHGPSLAIEPRYGSDVYTLRDALHHVWQSTHAASSH